MQARWQIRRVAVATAGVGVLGVVLTQVVGSVEPPAELRHLCADSFDQTPGQNVDAGRVDWVASPDDCLTEPPGGQLPETLLTVPEDRPVYLCAQNDTGTMRHVDDLDACDESAETPLDIVESGPIYMCAANINPVTGEQLQRSPIRRVEEVSACDPQLETAYVSPARPFAEDDVYEIDEDTLLAVSARGVLDNDRDLTPGPLVARHEDGPAVGTLDLRDDGDFDFDPRGAFDHLSPGDVEEAPWRYRAFDGKLLSEPATVTVRVTGVNDPPEATADTFTTNEDTTLSVPAPGVLSNDHDVEGDPIRAELVEPPEAGSLTLNPDGSLRYSTDGAFESLAEGARASVTFTYLARDVHGEADQGSRTTATIVVLGDNDAPVAVADAFMTGENQVLDIAPAELLANDHDADAGTTLAVTDVSASTPPGIVEQLEDGTLRVDPTSAFNHLQSGQVGTATFTYAATDGAATSSPATVTITVEGRSAPLARDDSAATDEDTVVPIDLWANDRLEEPMTSAVPDESAAGATITDRGSGQVEYDPSGVFDHLAEGQTATDTFTYSLANDEGASNATVTVVVEGRNDVPVAADDVYDVDATSVTALGVDVGLMANDDDVDTPREQWQARLAMPPDRGRVYLDPDGGFWFDPSGELDGGEVVTFAYRLYDGLGQSGTATVTLHVNLNSIPIIDVPEDIPPILTTTPVGTEVATVTATDPDGDPFGMSLVESSPFVFGRVEAVPGRVRAVISVAEPPAEGIYTLTVRATDNQGGVATATVVIRVDAPLAAVDDVFTAVGNTELVVGPSAEPAGPVALRHAAGVLSNDDGGANGDVFIDTVEEGATAQGGRYTLLEDGSFVYAPPRPDGHAPVDGDPCYPAGPPASERWSGASPLTDSFTYTIRRRDEAATATVQLDVSEVVWYVDSGVAGPGCGTSRDPYSTLAPLADTTGADDDLPGHTIYLWGETRPALTTGATLEPEQRLLGQGTDLRVAGRTLLPAVDGGHPTIAVAEGAIGISTNRDNTVAGLFVDGSGHGVVSVEQPVDPAVPFGDQPHVPPGNLRLDVPEIRSSTGMGLFLRGGPDGLTLTDVDVDVGTVVARNSTQVGWPSFWLDSLSGTVDVGTVDVTTIGRAAGTDVGYGFYTFNLGARVDIGSLTASAEGRPAQIQESTGEAMVTIGELTTHGSAPDANPGHYGFFTQWNAGSITVHEARVGDDESFAGVGSNGDSGTLTLGSVTARGKFPMHFSVHSGSAHIGSLHATSATRPFWSGHNSGTIQVDEIVARTPAGAIELLSNSGAVTFGATDLEVGQQGLRIIDNDGTVEVGPGRIVADSTMTTANHALVLWTRGNGSLTVAADITLQPAEGREGEPFAGGRSIFISDLGPQAHATFAGKVTDRARGIWIVSSQPTTLVSFEGGIDSATQDDWPLLARDVSLEVLRRQNVFRSRLAGAAVRLESVVTGPRGVNLGTIETSDNTARGLNLISVSSSLGADGEPSRVVVEGGSITTTRFEGVQIADSSHVTLRGLQIQDTTGEGISLTDTDDIRIENTNIQDTPGQGLVSVRGRDLTLEAVGVENVDGDGMQVLDPIGTTTVRNSRVIDAAGVEIDLQDTGADPATATVMFEAVTPADLSGFGGFATEPLVRVTSTSGGDLAFRALGPNSQWAGGTQGLLAQASGGGRLDVAVDGIAVTNADDHGIVLSSQDVGSLLTVHLAEMRARTGAGIQSTGDAGLRIQGALDGRPAGQIAGTVERVDVIGTGGPGVQIAGVTVPPGSLALRDMLVRASQGNGVDIRDSSGIGIDGIEVLEPRGHGLFGWNLGDLQVQQGIFDLRSPTPTTAGMSGIYLRHVHGLAVVNGGAVRGSTGDQVVIANGTPTTTCGTEVCDRLDESAGFPVYTGDPAAGDVDVIGLQITDGQAGNVGILGAGDATASLCLDLRDNQALEGTGYEFLDVQLLGLAQHPDVPSWLSARNNTGTAIDNGATSCSR